MSGPIISPDGTQIWNGVSWVPIHQNQISQLGLNLNANNLPRVVTIQTKTGNAPVFIIVGIICLIVVLAGLFYVIDSSDERDKKTVTVSEFVVVKELLWTGGEQITICNEVGELKSGFYTTCEVNLTKDYSIEISFSLESNDHTVNVMTMTNEEYQKFVNGEDAEYIGRLSELNTTNADLDSYLAAGEYVFIVHNY